MPGQRSWARPFKTSQPMTLGLKGFGGAVIHIQPLIGWTDAVAP